MSQPTLQISLKHLLVKKKKCVGLQFYPNKVIQALIKELPNPKWSDEFGMVYLENNKENLDHIFKQFEDLKVIPNSLPEENAYNSVRAGVKYLKNKLQDEL